MFVLTKRFSRDYFKLLKQHKFNFKNTFLNNWYNQNASFHSVDMLVKQFILHEHFLNLSLKSHVVKN